MTREQARATLLGIVLGWVFVCGFAAVVQLLS